MKKNLPAFITCTIMFLTFTVTSAQEGPGDGWEFVIIPHLWYTAIGGDVHINDQENQLGEFVEAHDFALLAYVEARYGKFGLFFRPSSVRISRKDENGTGIGSSNFKAWIFELAGTYRFLGDGSSKTTSADLFIGARRWDEAVDWIDPMLGLRVRFALSKKLLLHARGDLGGFNIAGNTSDLSWNLTADIAYRIAPAVSLWAGYHILHTKFNEDSTGGKFSLEGTIHGPGIGAGFHFGNVPQK